MTTVADSTIKINVANIQFSFLNSGDLRLVTHNHLMINQWIANPLDGSLNNIYLRFHEQDGIEAFPLLGVQSPSQFYYSDTQLCWKGTHKKVDYEVTFTPTEQGAWFWDVKLNGADADIDVIYGQDIGLADQGAIRSNEAYMSQYVDHKVFNDEEKGYIVCSRQNQPQSTGFPYLQQGSLSKIVGYSTDGFQFFGRSYKETNKPEALSNASLANEVYQYEFAYTALQSERVKLSGSAQFVFYGLLKENHAEAITALEFEKEISEAWEQVNQKEEQDFTPVDKVSISPAIGGPLQTQSMPMDEINRLFPKRHQEEWDGDTLLAFFTDTHEHIVLKEKELLVERPHGHILMSGNNVENIEEVITTTSYMYGIFNSQVVVGNTSFNKFTTNARNPLNVMKTSGQRIYVEIDGTYQLLTMPSLFEMGFNYARWYYKTDKETFVITNFTTVDSPEIHMHVRSESGKAYRYYVTNQVTVNSNEYEAPFIMEQNKDTITFKAGEGSFNKDIYPDLTYRLRVTGAEFSVANEQTIAEHVQENSASLIVLDITRNCRLVYYSTRPASWQRVSVCRIRRECGNRTLPRILQRNNEWLQTITT